MTEHPPSEEQLEREMATAERDVADGEAHIETQVKIVEKMRTQELNGLMLAEQVLETLRQSHVLALKHRDLLRREIDGLQKDNQLSEDWRVSIAESKLLTD
jgi:hypothetical protein